RLQSGECCPTAFQSIVRNYRQASTGCETLEKCLERLSGENVVFNQSLAGRFDRLCIHQIEVNQVILLIRALNERARIPFDQIDLRKIEYTAVVIGKMTGSRNNGWIDFDGCNRLRFGVERQQNILTASSPDNQCLIHAAGGKG